MRDAQSHELSKRYSQESIGWIESDLDSFECSMIGAEFNPSCAQKKPVVMFVATSSSSEFGSCINENAELVIFIGICGGFIVEMAICAKETSTCVARFEDVFWGLEKLGTRP